MFFLFFMYIRQESSWKKEKRNVLLTWWLKAANLTSCWTSETRNLCISGYNATIELWSLMDTIFCLETEFELENVVSECYKVSADKGATRRNCCISFSFTYVNVIWVYWILRSCKQQNLVWLHVLQLQLY